MLHRSKFGKVHLQNFNKIFSRITNLPNMGQTKSPSPLYLHISLNLKRGQNYVYSFMLT